jgi:hypothetical protein
MSTVPAANPAIKLVTMSLYRVEITIYLRGEPMTNRSLMTVALVASGVLAAGLGYPAPSPAAPAASASSPPSSTPPPPLPGSIDAHPDWTASTRRGDVDGVEHLVAALYDVISGPAGQPRDWQRFRSLFLPDGRLGAIRPGMPAHGNEPARKDDITFRTPDLYAGRNDPYFKTHGFFERGVANRVEAFGDLMHVWSTYESRHAMTDAAPFARGINSIEIVQAQGRFWLVSVLWDEERPGLTLPEQYLRSP